MYFNALACLTLLSAVTSAVPTTESQDAIAKRQSSLPLLVLPYGTYQASVYNSDADIYTFRNVRFAAAPVGQLRWQKPQPPAQLTGIQNGSVGFDCTQPGNTSQPQSEDCLFLDVYVPGKAARSPAAYSLPVVVWIFGGNNLNGAKDQLPLLYFNGTGPIQTSNNSIITVSPNYRLGPFGYLAGNTMELNGLPNAGLHDIRAAFKWVQSYISQVGGDKTKVTAWGESAGASNLFHQLVAQGGTLDPLFSKALLQSPASVTILDRLGMSENCFQTYSNLAGCGNSTNLNCLRNQTTATLEAASVALTATGKICGGVQSDGTYIRQAALLEYASNNYWKGLTSLITTHVANESAIFVPPPANSSTDAQFTQYVAVRLPTYADNDGILNATTSFYPPPPSNIDGGYTTEYGRFAAYIRDSSIFNHLAAVALAYANTGNVWVGEYSVPPAYHATDLIPLWWNKYVNYTSVKGAQNYTYPVPSNILPLSKTYQSYMVSQVLTGNPNTYANTGASSYPAINWPQAGINNQQQVTNVLNFTSTGVQLSTDNEIYANTLLFSLQQIAATTNQGGYAVPGTVQNPGPMFPQNPQNSSSRYTNQCSACVES